MNIKFSPKTTPSGSRFLYRNNKGELSEATIREWSSSGGYLNLDGKWITINDIQHLTLVEVLSIDDLYVARRDWWNKT